MPFTKTTRPIHLRAGSSLKGLAQGWRREGAIRMHVALSIAGLIALGAAQAPGSWIMASAILMLVGLSFELVNAAVEALLDRLHPDQDDQIGAAKDLCSAGAFLLNVAAAGAVGSGLIATLQP